MRRPLFAAVLALTTAMSILSAAQQKRAPKKPPSTAAAPDDAAADAAPLSAREEKPPAGAKSPSLDAGVVETKTLDGGARVFRFGEVEVEGRLKSPQIVYFLRRVRAEFAASDLGHRSFLHELGETRNEPVF